MKGFSSRVVRVAVGMLLVGVVAAAAVGTSGGTTQKQIQVALLFPGTEHDGSWANAWSDGAKRAAKRAATKNHFQVKTIVQIITGFKNFPAFVLAVAFFDQLRKVGVGIPLNVRENLKTLSSDPEQIDAAFLIRTQNDCCILESFPGPTEELNI